MDTTKHNTDAAQPAPTLYRCPELADLLHELVGDVEGSSGCLTDDDSATTDSLHASAHRLGERQELARTVTFEPVGDHENSIEVDPR